MAADIYSGAFSVLEKLKSETSRVLVAFSGGKESLCVLDMACHVFGPSNVTAVHLQFVPDLRCVEDGLDEAVRRHGMKLTFYPHPNYVNALSCGQYCTVPRWLQKLPILRFADVYKAVMIEHQCDYLLTGCRRSDSRQRRILMDQGLMPGIHPIADWSKTHVLAYLKRKKIPLPPQMNGSTTNISVAIEDICWLHDEFPEDFAKFARQFPFAESAVHRRRFYGYA